MLVYFFGYESHYLFDKMPLTAKFSYDSLKSLLSHCLFDKMPLKTNFSCDSFKRLLCGIDIHALGHIMFLLNGKLDVVAFDCLQHCGIGLDFNLFDIVGTLSSHDGSSVKHFCLSCDVNPNFNLPCDFVNQLLYYVIIEVNSIQELAMIVTFKLCETSNELNIAMSQHSLAMSSVHKSCVGYHDKLD